MAKRNPFRILSLAGGGYLGLYTACVLAELERRSAVPLAQKFDLIAGTSVGGILALGLAFEVPAAEIRQLFIEHGAAIFSTRPLASNRVDKLLDLARSVWGPKYDGKALEGALTAYVGKRTLADALHPVVVPAVDLDRSMTKIFKTPHAPKSRGDEAIRAVDVAMATAAAPAYFPSRKIGRTLYADGGMFAVAPDLVALHEAEQFMDVDLNDVHMLSVGTATLNYRPAEKISSNDGAVGWLSEGRLILSMIAVQQQHVEVMAQDRLGERYMHVDALWPAKLGLGIDVATNRTAGALQDLAADSLRNLDMRKLRRLFDLS
ncbi:MAG: CBASS cGAMP-activated phospholipase [Rudaea sp.]